MIDGVNNVQSLNPNSVNYRKLKKRNILTANMPSSPDNFLSLKEKKRDKDKEISFKGNYISKWGNFWIKESLELGNITPAIKSIIKNPAAWNDAMKVKVGKPLYKGSYKISLADLFANSKKGRIHLRFIIKKALKSQHIDNISRIVKSEHVLPTLLEKGDFKTIELLYNGLNSAGKGKVFAKAATKNKGLYGIYGKAADGGKCSQKILKMLEDNNEWGLLEKLFSYDEMIVDNYKTVFSGKGIFGKVISNLTEKGKSDNIIKFFDENKIDLLLEKNQKETLKSMVDVLDKISASEKTGYFLKKKVLGLKKQIQPKLEFFVGNKETAENLSKKVKDLVENREVDKILNDIKNEDVLSKLLKKGIFKDIKLLYEKFDSVNKKDIFLELAKGKDERHFITGLVEGKGGLRSIYSAAANKDRCALKLLKMLVEKDEIKLLADLIDPDRLNSKDYKAIFSGKGIFGKVIKGLIEKGHANSIIKLFDEQKVRELLKENKAETLKGMLRVLDDIASAENSGAIIKKRASLLKKDIRTKMDSLFYFMADKKGNKERFREKLEDAFQKNQIDQILDIVKNEGALSELFKRDDFKTVKQLYKRLNDAGESNAFIEAAKEEKGGLYEIYSKAAKGNKCAIKTLRMLMKNNEWKLLVDLLEANWVDGRTYKALFSGEGTIGSIIPEIISRGKTRKIFSVFSKYPLELGKKEKEGEILNKKEQEEILKRIILKRATLNRVLKYLDQIIEDEHSCDYLLKLKASKSRKEIAKILNSLEEN